MPQHSGDRSRIHLEQLARRRLLVVTGKGGVGKSTLTAALGRALAGAGHRSLLLEVDPRESLYPLLGASPSGGAVVRVASGLFFQNLEPRAVLDRVVRERLRIGAIADRVLASPAYKQFAEGAPGLKEMAVIAHALASLEGRAGGSSPSIDIVVLDAPATGHGLSLLAAPLLVSKAIRDGPVGRMGGRLARFVADPDQCGIVVATLAEEMPVQEAIELIGSLGESLTRQPDLVLVNGLYPAWNPGTESPAPENEAIRALWRERRAVNDRELHRLGEAWPGPRAELPLLPIDRGPRLTAELALHLERTLKAPT